MKIRTRARVGRPRSRSKSEQSAARWGRSMAASVEAVLAVAPTADPENIRHTLILLAEPPFARLARSLIRGRAAAKHR